MMDSNALFARAIDSLFTHLGREALYRSGVDPPVPILVIPRRPDQLFELGEGRIHGEDPRLDFRASEVPSPKRGEEIELDGRFYRIEAEPKLELHQLVWMVETLSV